MANNILYKDKNSITFNCPHCNILCNVQYRNMRCKIFRCGVYKKNNKSIKPHGTKEYCDYLVNNNLIYGCSKPFRIIYNNKIYTIEICDYI